MTPPADAVQARLEEIERWFQAESYRPAFECRAEQEIPWLCQQVRTLLARVAEQDSDLVKVGANVIAWQDAFIKAAQERDIARQQLAAALEEVARLAKGHDEYNRVNRILESELEAAQQRAMLPEGGRQADD